MGRPLNNSQIEEGRIGPASCQKMPEPGSGQAAESMVYVGLDLGALGEKQLAVC